MVWTYNDKTVTNPTPGKLSVFQLFTCHIVFKVGWGIYVKHHSYYLTLSQRKKKILPVLYCQYCKTSDISCTLVDNKIVDHSDVVGASPVCTAPTTSSISTYHLASMHYTKTTARQKEKHLHFGIWYTLY